MESPAYLDGVFWLVLTLGPLLILQRSLHKEIQALFLLITRRMDLAIALFAVLFFPGVLLHEGSHYLFARLVGVQTGRFSLIPHPSANGKLQLGYVETRSTDWLRDAIIGMAPLLSGGIFVAYAGVVQLKLLALVQNLNQSGLSGAANPIGSSISQPDFWLWFYLALVVSSTMLPSASDRRAWLPLGIMLVILIGLSFLLGAGPWMAVHLAPPFNQILKAVSIVFGISAVLHIVLLPFVWIFRRILSRILGMEVVI